MDFGSYVDLVRSRLSAAGFQLADEGALALYAGRREVKLTRFGVVETVVGVSVPRESATQDDLKELGRQVVEAALKRKTRIPRGLGSSLVVYPTLVVESGSPDLQRFVGANVPKHWSLLEFPVVADLTAQSLLYLERTPFWGAAYYRKTRAEAHALLNSR